MPTYDYRCDSCDHTFSAMGGFNDPPVGACPRCGETPRRLIVPPAIVFKGSGWYKTDSRGAPPSETGTPPATTAASGAAGAAKPATAEAAKPAAAEPAKSATAVESAPKPAKADAAAT